MIRPILPPTLIRSSSFRQSDKPKGKIISAASTSQSGLPKAPSNFKNFSQRAVEVEEIGKLSEEQRLAQGPVLFYAPPDQNIEKLSLTEAVSLLSKETAQLREALKNRFSSNVNTPVYVQNVGNKRLKNEIFPDLQENKGWEALKTLFFSGESREDHISTALGLLDFQIDDAVSSGKIFNLNIINEEGKREKVEIIRDPENSKLYSLKYGSSPQRVHQVDGRNAPELLRLLPYLIEREIVSSQKNSKEYWSQFANPNTRELISGDLGNIVQEIRRSGGENLFSVLSLSLLEPEINKVSESLQGRVRELLFGNLSPREIKPEDLLRALKLLKDEKAILPKQMFQTDLPAPTRPHTRGYEEKHRLTVAGYLGESGITDPESNREINPESYEPISSNPAIAVDWQNLHPITQQPVPANVSTVKPGKLSEVTTPHKPTDSAVVEENIIPAEKQDGAIIPLSLAQIIGVKQDTHKNIDTLKKLIQEGLAEIQKLEEMIKSNSEVQQIMPEGNVLSGRTVLDSTNHLLSEQNRILEQANDTLELKQTQLAALTEIEQEQRQQTASNVVRRITELGKDPAQKDSILSTLLKRFTLPPFYLSFEDKQFIKQEIVLDILNSMIPWGHLRREHLQINEGNILSKDFPNINKEDNKSLNTLALINSVLEAIGNPQELSLGLELTQADDFAILASRYTRLREIIQQTQPSKGFAKVSAPALNFSSERLKTLGGDYYSNSDKVLNLLKSPNGGLRLLIDVHSQWFDLCTSYDMPDSHKKIFPTIDKQKYEEINNWLANIHEAKPTSIEEVISNLPNSVKTILEDPKKFLKFVEDREKGTQIFAQEAASREKKANKIETKKTNDEKDNKQDDGGTPVKQGNPVKPKTPQGDRAAELPVTNTQKSSQSGVVKNTSDPVSENPSKPTSEFEPPKGMNWAELALASRSRRVQEPQAVGELLPPETEPPQSSKQTASRSVENISDPVEVNNPPNSSSNVNSVEKPNPRWKELKEGYTMQTKPLSPEEIAELTLKEPGRIPTDLPFKVDNQEVVQVPPEEEYPQQLTSTELLSVGEKISVPVSV